MNVMRDDGIALLVRIALLFSMTWSVCMNGCKQNISLVYLGFLECYLNVLSGILPLYLLLNAIVMLCFFMTGETCLGIVLRAESGDLLANKMIKLPSLHAIKECEVLALFDAISWVRTLEYNQVLFETGSQMVVNDLAYGSCNNTTFGVLMSSCHLLLCSEHDFKVVFVKRHANGDYTYFG